VTPHRRGPRPLAGSLNALRDELAPATVLAEVQGLWPAVVGPEIAAEAQPMRERGGVLTVSCSSSVWAQELDLMGATITTQLNARMKRGKLARLRCVAVSLPGE
jgi:predicted nucleic acid-binding Zn ribbon protein